MGVHVYDAGRQREAAGIDRPGAGVFDLADRGDASVLDRDIGAARIVAQPVDDGGASNDQIVHGLPPGIIPCG
jgi:hypothetical protein